METATFTAGKKVVLFTLEQFPGMVGERMSFYKALIFHIDDLRNAKRPAGNEATYEQLKEAYRDVQGRNERISYWQWMANFSPDGVKRRQDKVLEKSRMLNRALFTRSKMLAADIAKIREIVAPK